MSYRSICYERRRRDSGIGDENPHIWLLIFHDGRVCFPAIVCDASVIDSVPGSRLLFIDIIGPYALNGPIDERAALSGGAHHAITAVTSALTV